MVGRQLYGAAFVLGTLAFAVAFALGIVQSWQHDHRLPELSYDELGQAREASAFGDVDVAARQLRTYAALQPSKYDVWLRLGQFLQGHGDVAGAIEAYVHATGAIPAPAEAFEHLAILHYQRGELDAARANAKIALEHGRTLPREVVRGLGIEGAP